MDTMNDQTVVIMGGTSGIGLAAAQKLGKLGARVIVTGRDPEKAKTAALNENVQAQVVDASSEEALKTFFNDVQKVDHLVISVSGARGAGPFPSLSTDELRAGFDQKFWPQFLIARIGCEYLDKNGSLTFVTAASARGAMPNTAGLAAINGAIESMIHPLARELKPLRVNAISPGVVETAWWDRLPSELRETLLRQSAESSLLGRNGKAEELGDAIVFLIQNAFITGTVLEVDGGIRLT